MEQMGHKMLGEAENLGACPRGYIEQMHWADAKLAGGFDRGVNQLD